MGSGGQSVGAQGAGEAVYLEGYREPDIPRRGGVPAQGDPIDLLTAEDDFARLFKRATFDHGVKQEYTYNHLEEKYEQGYIESGDNRDRYTLPTIHKFIRDADLYGSVDEIGQYSKDDVGLYALHQIGEEHAASQDWIQSMTETVGDKIEALQDKINNYSRIISELKKEIKNGGDKIELGRLIQGLLDRQVQYGGLITLLKTNLPIEITKRENVAETRIQFYEAMAEASFDGEEVRLERKGRGEAFGGSFSEKGVGAFWSADTYQQLYNPTAMNVVRTPNPDDQPNDCECNLDPIIKRFEDVQANYREPTLEDLMGTD